MEQAKEAYRASARSPDSAISAGHLHGRGRGRPVAWLAMMAALAVAALLVAAVLRPAAGNPLVAINRPAPDFTMSLYGGGKLHLAALRGKTVVINFWWSGCIPCQEEAPLLERQWRAWKTKNVVFVGVDEIDDPHTVTPRDFLAKYGITYANGWDPGDVDIQYGTTGQPETFFITPRGTIKSKYAMPFPDDSTLARLVQEARS